jgi:hypothetical protein
MKNIKPKAGQIGFSRSKSPLSFSIRLFQWIYKFLWTKRRNNKIWAHAFLVIELYDEIYVCEANQKAIIDGYDKKKWVAEVFINKWEYTPYGMGDVECEFIEPIEPWSKDKLKQITAIAKKYVGTPYGYEDIGCQLYRTFTDKWLGHNGTAAEKEVICCELVATIINKIKKYFDDPASINLVELRNNKHFKKALSI